MTAVTRLVAKLNSLHETKRASLSIFIALIKVARSCTTNMKKERLNKGENVKKVKRGLKKLKRLKRFINGAGNYLREAFIQRNTVLSGDFISLFLFLQAS